LMNSAKGSLNYNLSHSGSGKAELNLFGKAVFRKLKQT
jgi:hypothetical protein